MNTADILDKAASLISQRGLAKGAHQGLNGGLCVRAAVIRAVSPRFSFTHHKYVPQQASQALDVLSRRIRVGTGWWGLPGWNDAPERTTEDVVSALRAAAQAARAWR